MIKSSQKASQGLLDSASSNWPLFFSHKTTCLALPCLPSLPACLSLPSTHTLPHQTGGGCQDTRRGHQGIGDYGTGRLCRVSCTLSLGFKKGMRSKERLHLSQTDTWEHFTALSVPQSCSSVLPCPAAVPVLSALVIMG